MRIAAALVVTALVGGGLGVIMLRGDAGGKKLLFSGLDLEEAAEITDKLDTANVTLLAGRRRLDHLRRRAPRSTTPA